MALDPRIALQGASFQAPDIQGALARGQEYRTNQMAQQAAQATAARNAMIRQRAASVDFNDRNSVNEFARLGPETTAYIQAAGAGDTLFNTRAAETRSQGEFDIKRNEAGMAELRTVVGRVFNNPDDASLADAAQRYPQFAADINRIAANPDAAARRTGLATLVAALPGGSEFLDAVTQEYGETRLGGSVLRTPKRTYLPGAAQTYQVTPDPNAPVTYLQTAEGYVAAPRTGGPATTVMNESGVPVSRPQPANRSSQTQENADLARQRASVTMREGATTMRGALRTLYDEGFLRGSRDTPVTGAGKFLRDAVPGARGLTLSMNPNADAAAQVAEGTISSMVGQLKDLYGTSSRAMDAVRELELALAQFGSGRGNYDAGITLLNNLESRLNTIDELYRRDMGLGDEGGGGDNAALIEEARRRGLIQ
jgi:hypothetical protein